MSLFLCETYLVDAVDSGNFSLTVYLLLIRKDSIIHMHGLAVYVKEGLPFARDLSLENSADLYLGFRLALVYSVVFFPLSITFFFFMHSFCLYFI